MHLSEREWNDKRDEFVRATLIGQYSNPSIRANVTYEVLAENAAKQADYTMKALGYTKEEGE